MVTLNEFLLIVNAITCAVIAVTLGTYQRKGATHKRLAALFAWVLIVACGSVTILIVTGRYSTANFSETAINMALCVAVLSAKGNVMKIVTRTDATSINKRGTRNGK